MSTMDTTTQPPGQDEVALPVKDHIINNRAGSASLAVSGSAHTKRPSAVVIAEHRGGSQDTSVKRRRLSSAASGLLALCDCDDVLSRVLGFLSAKEVDGSLKLVCKAMHQACDTPQYWRELLLMYGKPLPNASSNNPGHGNPYKQLYYRNPCVPVDFGTMSKALTKCSRAGSTITLMPGVYEEQLSISDDVDVTIQAAKPEVGAALVEAKKGEKGCGGPVVKLIGGNDGAGPTVRLSNLQILHSSPKKGSILSDVALLATGAGAHLLLDSCTIQSSSGRGIVIHQDASLDMQHTTVHDCAFTGLLAYCSESVNVAHCNIIRNGFGAPDGCSGILVASDVSMQDSLIAANSHAGLTVFYGNSARVSGCGITENGHGPLSIFDPSNRREEPGVLLDGTTSNNTTSNLDHAFGAPTRKTPFPSVLEKRTTKRELEDEFRAYR